VCHEEVKTGNTKGTCNDAPHATCGAGGVSPGSNRTRIDARGGNERRTTKKGKERNVGCPPTSLRRVRSRLTLNEEIAIESVNVHEVALVSGGK